MGTLIDMHVHTKLGSADSGVQRSHIVDAAREYQLEGFAFTEHSRTWTRREGQEFSDTTGLLGLRSREMSTEFGHILVYGGEEVHDSSLSSFVSISEFCQVVRDSGGFTALAHPFRYFPSSSCYLSNGHANLRDAPLDKIAELPIFQIVDGIETHNFHCSPRENALALEVTALLGKRAIAGSDAHSPIEIGKVWTSFEADITSEEQFVTELRSGRFGVMMVHPGDSAPARQLLKEGGVW